MRYTVELQWLEHLWNHENVFETGVVRAKELILAPGQETELGFFFQFY